MVESSLLVSGWYCPNDACSHAGMFSGECPKCGRRMFSGLVRMNKTLRKGVTTISYEKFNGRQRA